MLPPISVVVIGFNEAENLDGCFKSILNSNYPVNYLELIYVDSGSTDNSVKIAEKYTSCIYIETDWPTAARNRNRGLIESNCSIIHFIDGDIVIDKDYLRKAVEKLLKGDVHCVFGSLEEKNVKGIGKILLHDYSNRKPGLIEAPGAGGTFVREALLNVSGWDERIPRGEETELGERFKKAGYKIWFLDCKMGFHDYGINSFYQFLKKQVAIGRSFGAISLIPSNGVFFIRMKKILRNNFVFHGYLILIIILSLLIGSLAPLLIAFICYPVIIFYKYRVLRNIKNRDSIKYYFFTNLTRTALLFGFLKFRIDFYFLPENQKLKFYRRIDLSKSIKSDNC